MTMTNKQRCQVSGCTRPAKWAFNTTLTSLYICWYCCAIHAKQHEKDVGRTVPLERKAPKNG